MDASTRVRGCCSSNRAESVLRRCFGVRARRAVDQQKQLAGGFAVAGVQCQGTSRNGMQC
eukprot:1151168-Pelagomonas_calceolata.AAC.7